MYGVFVDYCSLGFVGLSVVILGLSIKIDGLRCILVCLEFGFWICGCVFWLCCFVIVESVFFVIGWLVIVCV